MEQQLARVGNVHLRNLCLVLARAALERVLAQVGDRDQSAYVTHVHAIRIGLIEQPVLQKLRCAVRDHAVAFHFSESKSTVARTTLHGLPGQDLHGPTGTAVYLVIHHVLEALVIGRPDEDLRLELAPRVAVVHHLVAPALISASMQQRRDGLHGGVRERRGIALFARRGGHFAHQALDELPDGHARRDGVRVDDDVRRDAFHGEGHVLLPVGHAHGALLSVSRRELVSYLWRSNRAHPHLHELVALVVGRQHHLVHDARLAAAQGSAAVSMRVALRTRVIVSHGQRSAFADDDVVT